MQKQKKGIVGIANYDSSGFAALDVGHALVKGVTDKHWTDFPHALMPLDDKTWSDVKARGVIDRSDDYVVVNRQPYAIGETAENHGWRGRLEGAARYVPEYYGVLAAVLLHRLFPEGHRSLEVMATHAPEYIDYRADMESALIGRWEVESQGKKRSYFVRHMSFVDEPIAAGMNVILDEKASGFQHPELQSGTGLVIDIGGFTTDAALLKNGVPDYLSIYSDPGVGIIRAIDEFKRSLRSRYAAELKNSSLLRPDKLRIGLATGEYPAGGYGNLECQAESDMACERLVTLVSDIYNRFGGTSDMNFVILAGGGAGLLASRLITRLNHPNVRLAGRPTVIHMSIAEGALKMLHLLKQYGGI